MSTTTSPQTRVPAFLCLAPVHSASFPKAPVSPRVATRVASTIESPPDSPVENKILHRASSTSSVGSVGSVRGGPRFLKLGPVFWGGVDGDDDYAIED